jgi:hypothetical protein
MNDPANNGPADCERDYATCILCGTKGHMDRCLGGHICYDCEIKIKRKPAEKIGAALAAGMKWLKEE